MKFFKSLNIIYICIILFSPLSLLAQRADYTSITPIDNLGKKWRIAYIEGGAYKNYPANLKAISEALMKFGWMERVSIPYKEGDDDAKNMWEFLSSSIKSPYIEFVDDAFYSANWDESNRKVNIESLKKRDDIDLILAFGTWAGQDLSKDDISVSTIVISTSNPLEAGIIKSIEDSGYDHLIAQIDPTRYQRQVELFYEIIGFKNLGIVYEDSPSGRTYASVDDVKMVAKQRGFNLKVCHAKSDVKEVSIAYNEINQCYKKLAPIVDAVYVTNHAGVDSKNITSIVEVLNQYKIPSFSQNGSFEVKHGLLMSIAQANFKYVGEFHAKTIAKVFNGAKPRNLTQVFENPSKIAINLMSARKIGFDPSIDLMGAADELYQSVGKKTF